MDAWQRSMPTMSGAEYEVQEALTALRRLLDGNTVRATTRVVLQGALMALEGDLAAAEAELAEF
jgi:hypothetical protein